MIGKTISGTAEWFAMMTGIIVGTRESIAHTTVGACGFYATVDTSGMSGIMTVIAVCLKPVF
jgi:hypothetical protein